MHLTEQGSTTQMYNPARLPFLQTGGPVVEARGMSGLMSNVVLMVACVVNREGMLQLMGVYLTLRNVI